MEDWNNVMESRGSVDVIYVDFIKAFDQVLHIRLLSKFSYFGFEWKVDGLDTSLSNQ